MFGLFRKRTSADPKAQQPELFDEEFQRRLEYLAIVSRRVFAGRTRAERRSRKIGSGIEFADHREYAPGDDFRALDWNLYARSGRLLLRLYEEEEDLSVYFILDTSRSMGFGEPPKLNYAKRLIAALAYISLANLDRVTVVDFSSGLNARLAPTRGKRRIFKVFDFLRPLEANGPTQTKEALRAFCAQHKRRGVAILVSDFYDPAGFEEALDTLRYHRFETFVIQLFDQSDLQPELHGEVRLVDSESGETKDVTVTPAMLRKYAEAHAAYRKKIEEYCTQKQVAYIPLNTGISFEDAVLMLLRRGGLVS